MSDNKDRVGPDEFLITKSLLSAISGVGVSKIVRDATYSAVDAGSLGKFMRISVFVAQLGITGAITAQVDKANNDFIDEVVGTYRALKEGALEDDAPEEPSDPASDDI